MSKGRGRRERWSVGEAVVEAFSTGETQAADHRTPERRERDTWGEKRVVIGETAREMDNPPPPAAATGDAQTARVSIEAGTRRAPWSNLDGRMAVWQ